MPVLALSLLILLAVTELAGGVVRRYFPDQQGKLYTWIIRVPAWLLVLWGLGVVLLSNTDANVPQGAGDIATKVMTLTGVMLMSAFYGCISGAGLTAMAINYARVPSGRKRALMLLLLALLSMILAVLPWMLAMYS